MTTYSMTKVTFIHKRTGRKIHLNPDITLDELHRRNIKLSEYIPVMGCDGLIRRDPR